MSYGPAKHLAFGGSTAHRWMRCAGSVGLCATLPPQPENEHMARGTRAHSLLEHALSERLDSVLELALSDLTQEDVEAVQVAVDYVSGILDANPDAEFYVEKRVTLHDDVGGTADVLIYVPSKRHLYVIDYKHGAGHYVTEDAPQFKFYATCAVMTMDELDVGTIYATVIQPRCWQGEPIRTAVYGVADLIAYSDDVDAARDAARRPDPAFVAGDWCDWCPAAHVCPAHRDSAFAIVTLPPDGDRAPVGEEIKIMLPPPGECRDPAVLAQTLPALAAMKSWISAMEEIAYAEAMAGKTIPGHKLVAKRGTRKWIEGRETDVLELCRRTLLVPAQDDDSDLVFRVGQVLAQALADAEHRTDDDGVETLKDVIRELDYAKFRKSEVKSVTQIEKALKGNKTAITALATLAEKRSSGLKLVASTEPGEPVNPLELLANSGGSPLDALT